MKHVTLEYTTKVVGLSEYTELYDKLVIISDDLQIQIKVKVYGDVVICCCLLHNLFYLLKVRTDPVLSKYD